ncbi:uncharacterized protein [Dysidea avara]|uniref:uncharacterized protein n=1 Tax=Dysidea avara TaxID=196820 RepID=UPI00332E49C4
MSSTLPIRIAMNIIQSWSDVLSMGIEHAGATLFKRLREIAPWLKKLEPFQSKREDLRAGCNNVFHSINNLVDLMNQSLSVDGTLKTFSQTWVSSSFNPEQYELVEDALLWTMEDIVKDKFTMEVRSNWIAFLGHLMMDNE